MKREKAPPTVLVVILLLLAPVLLFFEFMVLEPGRSDADLLLKLAIIVLNWLIACLLSGVFNFTVWEFTLLRCSKYFDYAALGVDLWRDGDFDMLWSRQFAWLLLKLFGPTCWKFLNACDCSLIICVFCLSSMLLSIFFLSYSVTGLTIISMLRSLITPSEPRFPPSRFN